MRKIEFRGIGINSKEWVYSMTIANGTIKRKMYNYYLEVNEKFIGVDSKTIGQYIGLTDKNSIKIFDGDLIKIKAYNYQNEIFQVVFEDASFAIKFNGETNGDMLESNSISFHRVLFQLLDKKIKLEIEIIGNIHQNPELLK